MHFTRVRKPGAIWSWVKGMKMAVGYQVMIVVQSDTLRHEGHQSRTMRFPSFSTSRPYVHLFPSPNFVQRNRLALVTTVTDDSAIAAPAIIGFNKTPNTGYNKPAATGILMVL